MRRDVRLNMMDVVLDVVEWLGVCGWVLGRL